MRLMYGAGRKCCMAYWKWVFGLNNNSKYYLRKGMVAHPDDSRKDVSIMTWFNSLKDSVDKMPDTNEWQLTAHFRKTVWRW